MLSYNVKQFEIVQDILDIHIILRHVKQTYDLLNEILGILDFLYFNRDFIKQNCYEYIYEL